MIDKNNFIELEEQIEPLVKQKQLKSNEARQLLDQYYKLIMDYFKQINEIEEFDIGNIEQYPVVPMNFSERYQYINQRIYHFMGYRQMVTLKDELIKMNARYQLQLKRKRNSQK
ncbi:YpoC family protein [Mammaliicoccus lentus]|uniref:YpoC family protein n=1 Tax=Mammaliicoccus lentus TaxID=42858 RepID=UPI00374ED3E0